MTISAQLADGTTLQFPDGTSDDVINRTVKAQIATPQQQPGIFSSIASGASAVADPIVKGAQALGGTFANHVAEDYAARRDAAVQSIKDAVATGIYDPTRTNFDQTLNEAGGLVKGLGGAFGYLASGPLSVIDATLGRGIEAATAKAPSGPGYNFQLPRTLPGDIGANTVPLLAEVPHALESLKPKPPADVSYEPQIQPPAALPESAPLAAPKPSAQAEVAQVRTPAGVEPVGVSPTPPEPPPAPVAPVAPRPPEAPRPAEPVTPPAQASGGAVAPPDPSSRRSIHQGTASPPVPAEPPRPATPLPGSLGPGVDPYWIGKYDRGEAKIDDLSPTEQAYVRTRDQSAPKPDTLPPVEPVTKADTLRPEPGPLGDGEKLTATPAGNQVRTRFEVVDASDLKPATGDLQNRDRSKAGTDLQVNKIVSQFDPSRLGDSAETDRGAPIVGPDNVVEAGNGRVQAINRVYDEHPDKVAAYQDHIRSMGLEIPEGMDRPVLVRRRMTDMSPEQRVTFVHDSNKDAKLQMSSSETARTDAHSLDPATMALYRGGDVEAQPNDAFRKAFMAKLTPEEQGAMVGEDGRMNNQGVGRLENALMARAYENPEILSKLMEARDNNIRSIGGAMLDHSGAWAGLKGDIAAGHVKPEFDITKQLVQAAREVSDLRNRGGNVSDYLEQQDAFSPRDPVTEDLVRAFYNKGLTRATGRDAIGDVLDKYVRRASEQTTEPSMFGDDNTTPHDILQKILQERDGGDQAALFDKEQTDDPNRTPSRNEGRDEVAPGQDERGQEGQTRSSARQNDSPAGGEAGGAEHPGDRNPGGGSGRAGADGELLDRSGIRSDAKGKYQDSFGKASFTDRASIYDSAVRDTGIDPDKFRLLPTGRQKALLIRGFEKKFGMRVQIDGGLQDRIAIDQLMDAHQNVQGMAHVLGVSNRAMSLGGQLGIKLLKKGNFLGVFYPGTRDIGLPQRSNSFAHEWGHALDYHILDQVGGGGRGVTGQIRAKGNEFEPSNVAEAWTHVLNSMFFDKAAMAQKVMEIEKRIAATKGEGTKKLLQAQIDNIARGTSRGVGAESDYFKGAAAIDRKSGGEYWTSPTEMFARSFEAYVSNMAESAGLGTEFIGKGDANYKSDAEDRFARTFPKGEERDAIFDAIGKMIVQVNKADMLGMAGDKPAEAPSMSDLRKLTDFDHHVEGESRGSFLKSQMDAIERAAKRKAIETADRIKDPKSGLTRLNDVSHMVFTSMSSKLKMIQARYGSDAVGEIHDKLTFTPGEGRHVPETFTEAATRNATRYRNQLANILRAAKLEHIDTDLAAQRSLRDALIGEDTGKTHADIAKAAAGIRTMMDGMFYDARNAGHDLGYATNGYLPRILDEPRIAHNEDGFLGDAAKAYEHVFGRDYGADGGDVMSDPDKLSEFLALAKKHDIEGVDQARSLLKQIKKFEDDPENNGEPANELHAKLQELIDEMHPEVRSAWANQAAIDWRTRQKTAADYERQGISPAAGFTDGRELTPEADKILEKYYLQNPLEAVQAYIHQNTRRVAYAERFGADGKILEDLTQKMQAQGVSREDQSEVLHVVHIVTGRMASRVAPSAQRALSAVHAYGVVRLLDRAVLTKLAEPLTAGMTAGDFREGFKSLARTIVGTRSLAGKERAELVRAMGTVADHLADHLVEANFGGQFGNVTRFDRMAHQVMERTGLLALHRVQGAAVMGSAHAYLDNLAGRVLEGDKAAVSGMQELGIKDPAVFAKQIRQDGRMPTVEELQTDYGQDYGLAAHRFIRMSIQEADPMARPQLANNPVGRVIYGITSFASSFFRNVIARQVRLTGQIAKDNGAGAAAAHVALGLLPAAAAMYAVQGIVSTMREFLLNPGRWADLEKAGTLEQTLAETALSRAFPLGIADPILQGFTGLKYHHDLSSLMIGPAPGVILEALQAFATPVVDAVSPDTDKARMHRSQGNASAYNAVKGVYDLAIGPALAVGLGMVPGNMAVRAATGVAMGEVTSQGAGDTAATAAIGTKTGRGTSSSGGSSRGDGRSSSRGGGRGGR